VDKVGIVVLNYLNYEDTIECVESLLDLNYDNYEIVIVDNGSDNNSFEILKNEFKESDNIYVLNTGENLGYAKGNNQGIDYCRNNLNAEHVMVINNDTIAEDKNLLNVLLEHKDDGIVLGPKIINLEGKNQNPHTVFSFRLVFNILIGHFLKRLNLFNYINDMFNKKNEDNMERVFNPDKSNLILHGSCFFFTKKYFNNFKGLFNKTFLYGEELILYILIKKVKSKMFYIDKTYIIHKEDKSSELAFSNPNDLKSKYSMKSFKWFLILYILPYKIINILFDI
jgi:GT2 family glycosyltransferase